VRALPFEGQRHCITPIDAVDRVAVSAPTQPALDPSDHLLMTSREPQHGPAGEDQPDQSQSPPLPSLSGAIGYTAADDSSGSTIKFRRCGTSRTSKRPFKDIDLYHCVSSQNAEPISRGSAARHGSVEGVTHRGAIRPREMWLCRRRAKTTQRQKVYQLPSAADTSKVRRVLEMQGYILSLTSTKKLLLLRVHTIEDEDCLLWYKCDEIGPDVEGFEKAEKRFNQTFARAEACEELPDEDASDVTCEADEVHLREQLCDYDVPDGVRDSAGVCQIPDAPLGGYTSSIESNTEETLDTVHEAEVVQPYEQIPGRELPGQAVPGTVQDSAGGDELSQPRPVKDVDNASRAESLLKWEVSDDMVQACMAAFADLESRLRVAVTAMEARRSKEEAELTDHHQNIERAIEALEKVPYVSGVQEQLASLRKTSSNALHKSNELKMLIETEVLAKRELYDKLFVTRHVGRLSGCSRGSLKRARAVTPEFLIGWEVSGNTERTFAAASEEIVRCIWRVIEAQKARRSQEEAEFMHHQRNVDKAIEALESIHSVPGAKEQLISLREARTMPPKSSKELTNLLEAEVAAKSALLEQRKLMESGLWLHSCPWGPNPKRARSDHVRNV